MVAVAYMYVYGTYMSSLVVLLVGRSASSPPTVWRRSCFNFQAFFIVLCHLHCLAIMVNRNSSQVVFCHYTVTLDCEQYVACFSRAGYTPAVRKSYALGNSTTDGNHSWHCFIMYFSLSYRWISPLSTSTQLWISTLYYSVWSSSLLSCRICSVTRAHHWLYRDIPTHGC